MHAISCNMGTTRMVNPLPHCQLCMNTTYYLVSLRISSLSWGAFTYYRMEACHAEAKWKQSLIRQQKILIREQRPAVVGRQLGHFFDEVGMIGLHQSLLVAFTQGRIGGAPQEVYDVVGRFRYPEELQVDDFDSLYHIEAVWLGLIPDQKSRLSVIGLFFKWIAFRHVLSRGG